MKRKIVIAVTLVLVSSLLLGACAASVAQEDYDAVGAERDAAQAQVTSLEAARDAAQAQVTSLEAAAEEDQAQVTSLEAARDAAQAQVTSLEAARDAARDTAQAQVADLEAAAEEDQALIAALQVTGKYHDVSLAEADGYVSTVECVEVPGLGGMGIHYVNGGLMEVPLDLLTPAILLYNPTDSGVKLIGVEYFMAALVTTAEGPAPWFEEEEPADGWFTSAPSLLGQTMEVMAGHDAEMPWHYDLHVWLWEDNPDGIFADFNPSVSCPE